MFNISYLLSFFLLLFLPFSNAVAVTTAPSVCTVTKTIQTNQWTQIGIPCEAPVDQNTVSAIFSDDIPGTYDTDWVLYSYNPTTNAYEKSTFSDTVEVGKGYWLISYNQSVTLNMPQGSQPASIQNSTQCLFVAGCFETVLVANPGAVQYQMLSSPFDVYVLGENLRINSGLETGLTLEESKTEDIFLHQLWNYNQTTNEYDEIQNQIISSWTGFWVATLPAASNNPALKLLFPVNTDPDDPSHDAIISLKGTVKNQVNAAALSDASVKLLKDGVIQSQNATTDSRGTFQLESLEANSNYILVVEKSGYATQIIPLVTLAESTNLVRDIILIKSPEENVFTGTDSIEITGDYGATVKINPNSFVDDVGNFVTGGIKLIMTALNTAAQEGRDALPGDLSNLVALGATEFKYIDETTGKKVQLAEGANAEITLPLFTLTTSEGITLTEGDTVGLWSLNEKTGFWEDKGDATVVALAGSPTGLGVRATVTHFSWWAVSARVAIKAFAHITATGTSDSGYVQIKARTEASVVVIAGGKFVLKLNDQFRPNTLVPIPGWSSSVTCFWAETFINGTLVTTPEQCITAEPDQHYALEFTVGGTPPPVASRERFSAHKVYLLDDAISIDLQYINAEGYYDDDLPAMNSFVITSGSLPPGLSLNGRTISGTQSREGRYFARGTAFTAENRPIPFSISLWIKDARNSPAFVIGANEFVSQSDLGNITIPLAGPRYAGIANLWFKITENRGNMTLDLAQFNIGDTATAWDITRLIYTLANDPNSGYYSAEISSRASITDTGLLTVNMPLPTNLFGHNPVTGDYEESYITREEFIIQASNGNKSDTIRIIFDYDELVSTVSNLTWQDDSAVTTNSMNWNDAMNYCQNLSLYGFNDWKLPTLAYFDDMSRASSSWVNNYTYDSYWMGTSSSFDRAYSYIYGDYSTSPKSNLTGVRCVRGEPSTDS